MILSLFLASRLSKKIVKPLNELDLDDPLSNEGYDELSPLLLRVYNQQKQLKKQAAALQKSQDEFAAATASMSEGLILLNDKCTILSINKAATVLLDTDQHCVGQNILTVNRDLELQDVLSKALNGEQNEIILDLHDGHYQISASPVISDSTVSGIALLIFDVTEKENAEQMRREFTANVSHELKTPLAVIQNHASMLQSTALDEEQKREYQKIIADTARRLSGLVMNILRLNRLENQEIYPKSKRYPLGEQLRCCLLNFEEKWEEKDLELEIDIDDLDLFADEELLEIVWNNLISNAIKFTDPGGTIRVSLHNEDGFAVVQVADTGCGMDEKTGQHIFDKFYQGDSSHKQEGNGLGLAMVRRVMDLVKGDISVESRRGQGTVFTVRIRLSQ